MAFELRYHGAVEIFIDGELVHAVGDMDATAAGENAPLALQPRGVVPLRFDEPGRHVIAVRMQPNQLPLGRTIGWADGFLMTVGPADELLDEQEWFFEIEEMADMILWDNDYLSESDFVDDSPEESDRLKKLTGITDNYFLEIADDPKPIEIESILSDLKALCRSICDKN